MENKTRHDQFDELEDLIRRFCAEAERKIHTATTKEEAETIKEKLCRRFGVECESSLVINATRGYIEDLIARTWHHDIR